MSELTHVSQRVVQWVGELGKGSIGNVHHTLCGLRIVETAAPGPFVDWAGWRATCGECVVLSRPAWQPWVEKVFAMAPKDAYEKAKLAYAKELGGKR